jgi:hypothetical protein
VDVIGFGTYQSLCFETSEIVCIISRTAVGVGFPPGADCRDGLEVACQDSPQQQDRCGEQRIQRLDQR